MGREPATVTRFERYWWGGIRSVVTVSEPEFTERDRLMILAQRRDESLPRNAHGILLSEATDPANEFAFEVVGPTTDFSERLMNKKQKKFRDEFPDDDHDALLWGVRRKT